MSEAETSPVDPDCGDVVHEGDLVITDASVPNDTDDITLVRGSVVVLNTTKVVNLAALAEVQCVQGLVQIESNAALASLDGLENLRQVDGSISIMVNAALADAAALRGLAQTSGFSFFGNPLLVELPRFADGFRLRGPSVVGFGGNGFEDFSGLLEVPGLTVTGELSVSVYADDALRSTSGLGALGRGEGPIELWISGDVDSNHVLEEIDLAGFERLRWLSIASSFPNVHTLRAPDLTQAGFVDLVGIDGLTDLSGFSALEEVSMMRIGCGQVSGGGFTSLAGLESLAVAPELVVASAPNLTSIDSLSTSLGTEHLAIINNPMLPGVDADAYAAAVGSEDAVVCGNLGQPPCGPYPCRGGE